MWDVPIGYLTKQGQALMKLMGVYDREYLVSNGLLSATGCGDAAHFYFWSDAVQRDIDSGRAIAEELLPGCSVEVHSLPKGPDPLFSPLAAGIGHPDPKLAVAAISGRIGGHPEQLTETYRAGTRSRCSLSWESHRPGLCWISRPPFSRGPQLWAQLDGPLNMAAGIAENFLLECHTTGMKNADVGWGRANRDNIRSMLLLQEAYNDIFLRTPYIARASGLQPSQP